MLAALMTTLLLAAADPASAGTVSPAVVTAPPPAAVRAAAKAANGAEQICWDETPTGSHFTKHVCATRQEVERAQRMSQDEIGEHARAAHAKGFGPQ